MAKAEQPDTVDPRQPLPPVVIDLGKVKRKRLRQLKKGRGPLLAGIHQVVETVRQDLGEEAEGKELLPVVILYRRKRKQRKGLLSW